MSKLGLARTKQHGYPSNVRRQKPSACWIRSLQSRGEQYGVQLLETCLDRASLPEAEQRWIAKLRSEGCKLLNCTDGGEGLQNPNAEIRARMTKARTGTTRPPRSPEWCENISRALKGRTVAPEARTRRKATMTGKPWSKAQHVAMKASWDRRREAGLLTLSPERRAQIAETTRAQWVQQSRHVRDLTTGITYPTLLAAGAAIGVTGAMIWRVVHGRAPAAKGHKLCFVDQLRGTSLAPGVVAR